MTLTSVAVVSVLAVLAPIAASRVPRTVVPGIVVEILTGVGLGPHGLGWFRTDPAVDVLALLGVTFLFFLAGLEVDLRQIRGRFLGLSVSSYALGLALALGGAAVLQHAALLASPELVAIALSATGLGLVVPILRGAGLLRSPEGVTTVAVASVAEFAAVLLLAVLFSSDGSRLGTVVLVLGLALVAVVVAVLGSRIGRLSAISSLVDSLSSGTVQLRVRLSVALVVCFAALAQRAGLEVVLGAFFAGGILNVVDRGMDDPDFRGRLDGLGYGFLVPVFFVTSGARLDLSALSLWPDAVVTVPLLLLLLLVARATPSILLRLGGSRRTSTGAGLMCATSLPFIVTATQVGVATGRLSPSTAAALTTAGLVGVCIFPALGVRLLRSTPAVAPAGRSAVVSGD